MNTTGEAGPPLGDLDPLGSCKRPNPVGQRIVLTVLSCILVVLLPFGPYRLWIAVCVAVIQLVATIVVRRRRLPIADELGNYLVVEHLLMGGVGLLAPSAYVATSIVAVASLGSNSPYLPARWHRSIALISMLGLMVPPLVGRYQDSSLVVGAGLLMIAHIAFNRSGTMILAEEAARSARHQADHDSMTGLPNRRVLRASIVDLAESGEPAGLLLLDIDNFKEINDTLGHDFGDEVLCRTAHRLAAVEGKALVARLGGDEFAIVVEGSRADVEAHAQRVIDVVRQTMSIEGTSMSIRISVGMAHSESVAASSMLRFADIAMYQAKRTGSGPVWYSQSDNPHSRRRMMLMQDLASAIDDGDIRPWYQPQIDVVTGSVVGAEALARWHHRDVGLIGAGELLEHVDMAGLHAELSRSMLRQAIDAASTWPDHLVLSVNVTLDDVAAESFADDVEVMLSMTGFSANRLTIEVVENRVEVSPDDVIATIERLHALGVSVSLDDFGQAASSLARLDLYDVDELKIDRRFISQMTESRRDRAIVDSVVELAARLDLRVVAEGVETAEMAQVAADAGIRIVQGYHYSRPTERLHVVEYPRTVASRPIPTAVGADH